ncbi:hypothetical protein Tco_1469646, partial [Tanacetum coccineum]
MDIIAGRLVTIQTEIRQVEQQKLQCEQKKALLKEEKDLIIRPATLDYVDDIVVKSKTRVNHIEVPPISLREASKIKEHGAMGEPVETVVRFPEVVEQKIPAYLKLIGEELVVATL